MVMSPEQSLSVRPQSKGATADNNAEWSLTNRVVGNQLIFRVKDQRTQAHRPVQVEKDTSGESSYHSRKPHRKSRTGCANCKKRRVKCDETKPKCRKCETYGIPCDYTVLRVQARRSKPPFTSAESAPGAAILLSSINSMATTDLASRIDQALRLDPLVVTKFSDTSISNRFSCVPVLEHFIHFSADANSMSDSHKAVTVGDMLRVAFQTPYLMHAVLGVATTHLSRLLPSEKSNKVASAFHWERAIKLYKNEITKPIGLHNMDGLMSTCMLMSVLSFSAEEYKPTDSWLFTSDPNALNWLLVQCGLRLLLLHTNKFLYQSIWFDVFQESDDEHRTFDDHRPGKVGLHLGLAELCDIDDTTTEETNPYHWPLRMVSPMLPMKADRSSFSKMITFMGRLLPDYTSLLVKKDPRAVLVLSYWLGKICEMHGWWGYSRVHAECTAICMYLENSEDSRLLKLLEYPAERCGYLLRHVREEVVSEANIDLPVFSGQVFEDMVFE